MIGDIKKYSLWTKITFCLSLFNFLLYFSMRVIWTGIDKVLGDASNPPLWFHDVLFAVMLAIFIAVCVLSILKKEKIPMYVMFGLSCLMLIALFVIIYMGAIDYLIFILRDFLKSIMVLVVIVGLIWIVKYYPKTKCAKCMKFQIIALAILIAITIIDSLGLGINYFTYKPVVYAVEDKYQIVFSSSMDSTSWVEVGNETYYDLYAGSSKGESSIHKVEVPMQKLNEAKEYTVNIRSMLYRGPYGSSEGPTRSITIPFRPIDTSDGFYYYTISDVHGAVNSASKCASYFNDKLDLFIMLGDIYSLIEEKSDLQAANVLAYNVTKGQIPVIYARGNHETKGEYADQLYKYVGSKNEKFYFDVLFDDLYAIVLDGGEDHNDNWWEYYGTAHFDLYRDEQTAFLNDIIAHKDEKYDKSSIKYKMVLSHFPLTYVNKANFLKDYKEEWTSLFNEMEIDMHLSGHEHELFPIIPGDYTPNTPLGYCNSQYTSKVSKNEGYYTDADFYAFIVSKRGNIQSRDEGGNQLSSKVCGLATKVDFTTNEILASYTNNKLEKINIVSPFSSKEYGTEFELELK